METKNVRLKQQKATIFLRITGQKAIGVYNPFNLTESKKDADDLIVRRFEDY